MCNNSKPTWSPSTHLSSRAPTRGRHPRLLGYIIPLLITFVIPLSTWSLNSAPRELLKPLSPREEDFPSAQNSLAYTTMHLCWEEAPNRVGIICLTMESGVPKEELARGTGGGETSKEPRGKTTSEGWPSTCTNLNDTALCVYRPQPGPSLGQSEVTPRVGSFSGHRTCLNDTEPHASMWLPVPEISSCM